MARTKGIQVYPNATAYVRQANALSRAAYLLSGVHKRMLAVLISQVQVRDNGFELLEVAAGDMLRALEIDDSHYDFVRDHMKALRSLTLDVDTEDEGWKIFGWVDRIEYVKSRDVFKFKLGEDLLPYILDLKEEWAQIAVTNLNKLTGKYAHRLYEMIMATKGFAGKAGNKPGEWFLDLDFEDIRIRFKIGEGEYDRTTNFRTWVIDNPIREINEANIGIKIQADYDRFRRGRTLSGVRLMVKSTLPGEPRNVTPTKEEDAEEALIAANQELFDKLLRGEPLDMFGGGDLARRGRAYQTLIKHPECKHPPKRRGRRPKANQEKLS